jgi:hypothetical protein
MKGKVLSDAYLEFIIVNKVCEQWHLSPMTTLESAADKIKGYDLNT